MTYCAQPIKVPFNSIVFPGTELIMRLPKMADAISRIRLVISSNTLEEIINECEIIGIEKLWGEFIRIENDLLVSIEKANTRSTLNIFDLPFHCLRDLYFDPIDLRILFNGNGSEQLDGHLLIDYVATSIIPSQPYFKKIRQVSVIKTPVNSSSRITLDVYLPGSVYELFFTVRDLQGQFVTNLIQNIRLLIDDRERFSLSGEHFMYIEPLKKYGSFSSNIMTYSFSEDGVGQTTLSSNQRFIFDFVPNSVQGTLTIWSCSRNFVYNQKKVFESYELSLSYKNELCATTLPPVPLRTSAVNLNSTMTVITNSPVDIQTPITQVFNSTQSITYSSPGYSDVTCKYTFAGNTFVNPTMRLFAPAPMYNLIDGNQRQYNSYAISLITGIPTISSFSIDEYANMFILSSIGTLYKYSNTFSELYSIPNVSCLPATYFGFEAIPLNNNTIQTTYGIINTSNVIITVVSDGMNLYTSDGYTVCKYLVPSLVLIASQNIGNSANGFLKLISSGGLYFVCQEAIYVLDENLNILQTDSFGVPVIKCLTDDFDSIYFSFSQNPDIKSYTVACASSTQTITIYGADWYDFSIGQTYVMVFFGCLTVPTTITSPTGSFSITLNPSSASYIYLDRDLQFLQNNTLPVYSLYFNFSFNLSINTTAKYDATYFLPSITGTPFIYSGTITSFTAVFTPGTGILLSWTGTNLSTVSVALVSGPSITGFTSPHTYSGTTATISSGFTNGSSYTFSITPIGGTTYSTQPTVTTR